MRAAASLPATDVEAQARLDNRVVDDKGRLVLPPCRLERSRSITTARPVTASVRTWPR